MFKLYLRRLLLRLLIAGGVLYLYFTHRELLLVLFDFQLFVPLSPLHLIWALLMANMLVHLLPKSALSLAGRKQYAANYAPPPHEIDRAALAAYVRHSNRRAARVMLLWLFANAVFAALYFKHVIGPAELILLWALYFIGDLVCMIIFCPFQSWLMKNRCCVNCRIFDWGHFMMYTPFALINSFFSRSLFAMACLLLLHWELNWARHPERFWRGANSALVCANCRDRLCRVKRPPTECLAKNNCA